MLSRRHSTASISWNLGRTVVVVSGLIGMWVMRNLRYGSTPLGARIAIHDAWHRHGSRTLHGALAWWFTMREAARKHELDVWLSCASAVTLVICAVVLIQRSRRAWLCLLFTALPAGSYALLMALCASRVKFDAVAHPRFWVPVWPLTFIALASAAACATTRIRRALSAVVIAALVLCAGSELVWFRAALPRANHHRRLLSRAWRAAADTVPEPRQCRLYATDLRPLMLHRRLGPASEIPQTIEIFNQAAMRSEQVCIAVFSKKLRVSSSASDRRVEQNKVVAELKHAGRLEVIKARAGVTLFSLRERRVD
jgi:hypothetical protein